MRADTRPEPDRPAQEQVAFAVEVFRMLADATRVRLLWALLVHTRRQGTQVFYRIENAHVCKLVQDAIYHADHAGAA